MTNSSATGGYLAPTNVPLSQDELEDLVRAAVVGLTGLAGALVRPRWQEHPAPVPGHGVNWCAVGVQYRRKLGQPATVHDPADDGSDTVMQWVQLTFLVSLYGPDAPDLAARLESGLEPEQNRAELRAAGLALVSVGDPLPAPERINETWTRRVDMELIFEIEERRVYPVRNLAGGNLGIRTDSGQDRALTIKED